MLGPCIFATLPVVKIIPSLKPNIYVSLVEKLPAAISAPMYSILDIVKSGSSPRRVSTRSSTLKVFRSYSITEEVSLRLRFSSVLLRCFDGSPMRSRPIM